MAVWGVWVCVQSCAEWWGERTHRAGQHSSLREPLGSMNALFLCLPFTPLTTVYLKTLSPFLETFILFCLFTSPTLVHKFIFLRLVYAVFYVRPNISCFLSATASNQFTDLVVCVKHYAVHTQLHFHLRRAHGNIFSYDYRVVVSFLLFHKGSPACVCTQRWGVSWPGWAHLPSSGRKSGACFP